MDNNAQNKLCLLISSELALQASQYAGKLSPKGINTEVMAAGMAVLDEELSTFNVSKEVIKGYLDRGEKVTFGEASKEIVSILMKKVIETHES